MHLLKLIISILILLIPLQLLRAQELRYRTFTMQDGLSQMKTTCLLKDEHGYLWVGTRSGLNRFDGERFEIFTTQDGLLHNRIHDVQLLPNGHLLIMTFEGINVFDGQIMKAYPRDFSKVLYDTALDKNGNFWILPINTNILLKFDGKNYFQFDFDFIPGQKKLFYEENSDLKYLIQDDQMTIISDSIIARQKLEVPLWHYTGKKARGLEHVYYGTDRRFHEIVNGQIRTVEHLAIQKSFPELAIILEPIYEFQTGQKHWDLMTQIKNQLIRPIQALSNKDGSIWVGTENGLVHIPNPAIFTIPQEEAPAVWIIDEDRAGNIFMGSYGKGLFKLKMGNEPELIATPSGVSLFYPARMKNAKGDIIFGAHQGMYNLEENKSIQLKTIFSAAKDTARKQYVLGSQDGIYLTKDFEKFDHYDQSHGLFDCHYIQTVSIDHAGNYWLGSYDGLSRFDPDAGTFENYTQKNGRLPAQGVFAIYSDDYQKLWLAADDGLMTYDVATDSIIPVPSMVITQNVKSLARYDDQHIIVGAKDGLYLLNVKKYWEDEILDIRLINAASGYDGVEPGFEAFFRDSRDRIWITSATTVNFIEPDQFNLSAQQIQCHITHLNEQRLPFQHRDSLFTVDNGNDFLNIQVDGIGDHRTLVTKYQYRLDDEPWSAWSAEKNIFIGDLAHGRHEVQVRAGPTDSPHQRDLIDRIQLNIFIPIYKRAWFLPLMISLLLLAAGWLIYSLVRVRAANRRYQQQLTRSKYLQNQLLLAEMNPHFIFNVLASIQHKVLTNNKKEANEYLIKLSGIMRNFLTASYRSNKVSGRQDTDISLEKEIELISAFVDFERIKSDEHFDYQLTVSPNIEEANIYLPPMLIQPFVENAIKHGLLLADRKGHLTICFDHTDEALVCTIEDDGVGLQASKAKYAGLANKNASYGTRIVEERIALLNQLGHHIEVSIKNLKPQGTLVKIIIHEEA